MLVEEKLKFGGGGVSLLWFKNYVMKIATCMWKLTTTSPF